MRDVRPPTLLVVDGNEVQRQAVGRMLAAAGFWILEAATGADALRLAAKQPHLIVLDVNLPDMEGAEVCRRLKHDGATARIPVVYLSATSTDPAAKAAGLESGADAYLAQPCDPRELLATIRSLLRVRSAEETARAGAREWQQTFNAITDAICLVDFQGNIVRHNRAMQELVRAKGSLHGRSVYGLLQEALGADPATLPSIKGTYSRQSVDLRIGTRWFRVALDPVLSPDGTLLGAVKILSDITEERRAQERFRTAQELSLDAYMILRPVTNVVGEVTDFQWEYLNPAAAKAFHHPVEQLLGRRLLAVFPGHRSTGLFESYVRVWNTGQPHDLEVFYDADGITGWFRNMAIKLDDGVAVSFSDITERKRAEAALRLNEKLAATGRLAASIAHEINNPMASVTNLLYLLDTHPGLDPKSREYVSMARQEVSRISHIVKQMLGFYRESPKPVPVNLCDVLQNVLDLFRHKLDAARVRVETDFLCQDEVQAFPGEMRQVFTNLIGNAVEAIAQGGRIFVRVAAGRDWHSGRDGIRVLVADDGPGIRPEHRARLFEPFFTTKGEKGTGLGLWLTHGIVRKHNGSIRIRTSIRPGRSGTAFSVFLPQMANQRIRARAAS
jgi:signal transduction histidine kinase/DNA-binding response OmpR family regulator